MTSVPATSTDRPKLTVLRARHLFDGERSTLLDDPVLVMDGATIIAVDQAGRFAGVDNAEVIDLPGTTLMPGLIDTHVHLCFDAGRDVVRSLAERDDSAALTAMAEAGRIALAAGVTTVRDLGDRRYLSLALRQQRGPLPTIVAAGPPITSPGGHCHFLGGAASGVEGLRLAVQERAERGVDVIKIMASGGHLTPGSRPEQAQFSPAELAAVVDEAHRFSLPVTAHAHGTGAIADAVGAGVDGMEHVTFQTADGIDAPSRLIRAIADRRIVVGATLGMVPVPGVEPPPQLRRVLPTVMDNLRRLIEAGVPVVLGSDAGIGPVKPHDVLPHAIAQLTGLGVSSAEALRTATSHAAEVIGLGHRKGRLAPGFDSDVVAVDGNPLREVSALHRIRAVYARGRAVLPVPAAGGRG